MKNDIKKLIKEVVNNTADKIKPQKVILFGSYAYGKPNKDSDVDLLFIINTKLTGLKRYAWATESIEHVLPMDILVKTPTEIKKRLAMGDPFYKEITTKGKIMYESTK